MSATNIETQPVATGSDDDLDHLYCCCSPDLSICGIDISDLSESSLLANVCVVCDDLIEVPCRFCGYGLDGPCACGNCNDWTAA